MAEEEPEKRHGTTGWPKTWTVLGAQQRGLVDDLDDELSLTRIQRSDWQRETADNSDCAIHVAIDRTHIERIAISSSPVVVRATRSSQAVVGRRRRRRTVRMDTMRGRRESRTGRLRDLHDWHTMHTRSIGLGRTLLKGMIQVGGG